MRRIVLSVLFGHSDDLDRYALETEKLGQFENLGRALLECPVDRIQANAAVGI